MTESPFSEQGDAMTVTLKYGKDFGDPWLVIRGSSADETKRRVAEAVGLEGFESLTLAEVIVNAKNLVQATNTVAAKLGGVAIPKAKPEAEEQAPDAQATAEEQEPDLLERINALTNKRSGQQLYISNRAVIDGDPDLKAAMVAKMKSL